MRRLLPFLALVLLAACGGDEADGEVPPDEQLLTRVEAYTRAFGEGDADAAWGLVSERCRGEIGEDRYRAVVVMAGDDYAGLEVVGEIDADVDGRRAGVSYDVSASTLNQSGERWIAEDDGWFWDDC